MGGSGFQLENDFISGFSFGEGQEGFIMASAFANDAVYFPMARSLPLVDMFGALLYADALRGPLGLFDLVVCALAFGLFPKVLVGDFRDEALVYVAVEGGS